MIFRETYAIAFAHHLPTFPAGHKCRNVHGHTAEVVVELEAAAGGDGYAFDHADLDAVAREAIGPLDHTLVNDVAPELADGLSESMLAWIVARLSEAMGQLPGSATLRAVEFHELSTGGALRLVDHVKVWRRHAPGVTCAGPLDALPRAP